MIKNISKHNSLFLYLSVALISHACTDSNQSAQFSNEVVKINPGGTELNIPGKYLMRTRGSRDYKGNIVSIGMWALLPDFKSYDKNKNKDEFVNVRGWGKRIFIDLSLNQTFIKIKDLIYRYERNKELFNGEYEEIFYGLERYNDTFPGDDIFLAKNNNNEVYIWFVCSKDNSVPSPGCRGKWDYSDEVRVNVSFSRTYLSNWKNIKSSIDNILSSKE